MRHISIDRLIDTRSNGTLFPARKRRRVLWLSPRPKFFTTVFFFLVLHCWLRYSGHKHLTIPKDSFAYLDDKSLVDILNTTLGFQKILVLNLPYRTDRRDAMSLSAASSNMQLSFIPGVTGDSIKSSAYPPPEENRKLSPGMRGSWRTHMNALQKVVEQNLTTALIMEDDADWDIRVRQNLQRFALASRFLVKEDRMKMEYNIDNRPNPETSDIPIHNLNSNNISSTLFSVPLSSLPQMPPQHTSPLASTYAPPSTWDILWLGHCGTAFPRSSSPSSISLSPASLILTHPKDTTVPSPHNLRAHPFQGTLDPLASAYPPHTRIFHRATGGTICTVAYAVSQRGARRLLQQFGLKGWNGVFDVEMGRWCAGMDPDMGEQSHTYTHASAKEGGKGVERVCITTQPPIFAHHNPVEGVSDISGLGGGYAMRYETKYLRLSVRMNLERIVQAGGGKPQLVDQWPDEGGQVVP